MAMRVAHRWQWLFALSDQRVGCTFSTGIKTPSLSMPAASSGLVSVQGHLHPIESIYRLSLT